MFFGGNGEPYTNMIRVRNNNHKITRNIRSMDPQAPLSMKRLISLDMEQPQINIKQPQINIKPKSIDYSIKKIYIISRGSTYFFANILHDFFKNLMIESILVLGELTNEIITEVDNNSNCYLFIIGYTYIKYYSELNQQQKLNDLPKNKYIIYQIEQLNQSNQIDKFNTIETKLISDSYAFFDYSVVNLQYYNDNLKIHINILRPLIDTQSLDINNKTIDILFFGALNSRRKAILDKLNSYNSSNNKNYVIKIVDNIFGNDLIELIKKSKLVINLHHYPKAILEIFRIHELLAYDCKILSENPGNDEEIHLVEKYDNIVSFFSIINDDLSNIEDMFNLIDNNLENNINFDERNKFIYEVNEKNKQNLYNFLYRNLLHKYVLNLANPNDNINYNIIQNNVSNEFKEKKYYAHLHCYDISKFNEIYGEYIDTICRYFSVVITYSIGENTINNDTFVILKIQNKGLDIGSKFCAVAYLNHNQIAYEYVLFLHSKSNPDTRRKYFKPLIDNLDDEFIENINENDGYFPDIQWEIVGEKLKMISGNPEFADSNLPERNLLYRNELLKYLGANNNTNKFIEGNCYILSKKVVDKLFTDPLLYNILNTDTSFDYNWISKAYNIQGDIYKVYKQFQERKLAPRNQNSFDGYLEHVFQRVILNFCNNYKILDIKNKNSLSICIFKFKICFVTTVMGNENNYYDYDTCGFFNKFNNHSFFLFTNIASYPKTKGWDIKYLSNEFIDKFLNLKLENKFMNIFRSRFIKFQLDKVLDISKYDAIFYCDALFIPNKNIDWSKYIQILNNTKNDILQCYHKNNNNVYQECKSIFKAKKDSEKNMFQLFKFFKEINIDQDYIITENGTFGYNPKNNNIINIFNKFWNIYITFPKTYRDQPLWAYICWKYNVNRYIIDNFNNLNSKSENVLFLNKGNNEKNPLHIYCDNNETFKTQKTIVIASKQYAGYGGAATNAYNLVIYLRKHGFNVCGIFFNNDLNVNYNPEKLNGIFIYRYNFNKNKVLSDILNYTNKTIDICLAKNYDTPNFCKYIFNCKVIYLVSGISYFLNKNLIATDVLNDKYIINNLERNPQEVKSINNSDLIVCNSLLTKKLYNKIWPESKNKLYSNYIDTSDEVLNKQKNIINNKERIYDIVFCVSNLSRIQKNIDLVVKIFNNIKLKDYRKCIIGFDNNDDTKKKLNKNFNIEFKGLLEPKLVLEILNQSKILLMPSFFDSNPNIVKEALLYKCIPIITKNIGGYEIFPEDYICSDFNENTWVNKILDIFKEYDKFKDIKLNFTNKILLREILG